MYNTLLLLSTASLICTFQGITGKEENYLGFFICTIYYRQVYSAKMLLPVLKVIQMCRILLLTHNFYITLNLRQCGFINFSTIVSLYCKQRLHIK